MEAIGNKVSVISNSFIRIFQNNQVTIVNIVGVVLAFVTEYVIEENNIFSCPCIKDLAYTYGLSFIFGGAALFWMLGLLVYSQTWKACHGWRHVTCNKNVCCIYFRYFIAALSKTSIVPLAWVFAILLDGDYIACVKAPDGCTTEDQAYKTYKKLSQLWGFWALCGLFAVVCLYLSIARCFYKGSYLHCTFAEAYRKVEEQELFNNIKIVDDKAKEVVSDFLKISSDLKKEDWEEATNEDQELEPYFSPLHKFIEMKNLKEKPTHPVPAEKDSNAQLV